MAFPSLTEYFDTLTTSTWPSIQKKVVDQMYRKLPLLYWLDKKARTSQEGGRWFGVPVQLRKNTATTSFGRGKVFDQVDLDPVTMLKGEMKYIGTPLTLFYTDEMENSGKEKIIDMAQTMVENTVNAHKEHIQNLLWASAAASGTDITPLRVYIAQDPTTNVAVLGLNQSTEADWRNQYKDSDSDGSAMTYLLPQMRDMAIECEKWGNIDYILAGASAFSIYDDVALEQKMITDARMGDAEFAKLAWRGIPIALDTYGPTDEMYFIDSSTFDWKQDPRAYVTWTKSKEIPNQLDKAKQLISRCELICTKRKANGVIFDIAA